MNNPNAAAKHPSRPMPALLDGKVPPAYVPRHTEAVALETNHSLMAECSELMRSMDPRAHALAAMKFEECAANSLMAMRALEGRDSPCDLPAMLRVLRDHVVFLPVPSASR